MPALRRDQAATLGPDAHRPTAPPVHELLADILRPDRHGPARHPSTWTTPANGPGHRLGPALFVSEARRAARHFQAHRLALADADLADATRCRKEELQRDR